MNSPASNEPESDLAEPSAHAASAPSHDHPDPLTGEPHAHPVGVGVGALSAGAAGAAIGTLAGPVGVVVGAVIGAIAGGMAGKEVAESPEISPTSEEGGTLDEFDRSTAGTTPGPEEIPLSPAMSERTNPTDDAFFTGVSEGSHRDAELGTAAKGFDRSPGASVAAVPVRAATVASEDKPLPTASSGLITPGEDSFFADSTTGGSSMLVEHPYPAAHAVSPGDHFADFTTTGAAEAADGPDAEHAVRTGAYYRFLGRERTGEPGSELEDWIAAEEEVRRR